MFYLSTGKTKLRCYLLANANKNANNTTNHILNQASTAVHKVDQVRCCCWINIYVRSKCTTRKTNSYPPTNKTHLKNKMWVYSICGCVYFAGNSIQIIPGIGSLLNTNAPTSSTAMQSGSTGMRQQSQSQGPSQQQESTSIYVSNLPLDISEEELGE